ncbi:hypothetical protein L596_019838 [Steinernema carpocapsae]|uniref:Uncharacterized protein n=1 Tax=Steinernema carpocapsae TaxID=34508 RepID=A0A4U5MRW7_STECR|nr:hypothetical protein L596_019838 [Steinernema carpocapsae]
MVEEITFGREAKRLMDFFGDLGESKRGELVEGNKLILMTKKWSAKILVFLGYFKTVCTLLSEPNALRTISERQWASATKQQLNEDRKFSAHL